MELWSTIQSKLPPELSAKLKHHLELALDSENDEQTGHLGNFVRECCAFEPANFQQFIAYAMTATSIELLNIPLMTFRTEKSSLLSHTFSAHTNFWPHDQEKVCEYRNKYFSVHTMELLLNFQSILGNDSGRGNLEGVIKRHKCQSHHYRHSRLQPVHIQCVGHFTARCDR